MCNKKSIFLILIFASMNILAQMEPGPSAYLSLEEAVSRALEQNNLVKSSEYQFNKAIWDKKKAAAQLIPSLNFNTRYTWIDEQTFAERDFRRYLPPALASQIPQTVYQNMFYSSFDVSAVIFQASLFNNLSVADENKQMYRYLNQSTRELIIFQVVYSYVSVIKSQEILSIQKDFLDLAKMNYEKANRLYESDRYSKNDALRWKVEYQTQKSAVTTAETALRANVVALNRMVNLNMHSDTKIESKIPDYLQSLTDSVYALSDDEILNLILLKDDELIGANSSLSASASGAEISRLRYKDSYNSYLPVLTASYSYGWRENNTFNLDDYSPKTLRVNLSIPIFSGFKNYTNLQSKFFDYKKSEENFKDEIKNVRFLLTEIVNRLVNLRSQIEINKSNIEFNENNYRMVATQKDKGLASNIDLLDANLNLQKAKLTTINAKYDFLTSITELYYLLGRIDTLMQ